jgi:hypothetical protein
MKNGYIRIPRSLLQDPLWICLPLTYRHVYLTILENMAFAPTTQDDFGVLVHLNPGQLLTTERDLVDLCRLKEIDRSLVRRSLVKFLIIGFSTQTSAHRKTIITITRDDILELVDPNFDPNSTQTRPKLDPNSTQTRPLKEEYKNEKNEKNIYVASPMLDLFFSSLILKFPEVENSVKKTKQEDEIMKGLVEEFGEQQVKEVIRYAHGSKFWIRYIHTVSKLREKYLTLLGQLKGEKEASSSSVDRRTRDKDGKPVSSPADGLF